MLSNHKFPHDPVNGKNCTPILFAGKLFVCILCIHMIFFSNDPDGLLSTGAVPNVGCHFLMVECDGRPGGRRGRVSSQRLPCRAVLLFKFLPTSCTRTTAPCLIPQLEFGRELQFLSSY